MAAELDDPYILLYDKKISIIRDLLPVLEAVAKAGRPAFRDRRRHRRRSASDAGREQPARRAQSRRRQGARVRRPPQGDAAGHRDPDGRQGHFRRGGPQPREDRRSTDLGTAKKVRISKEETTIVDGGGEARGDRGPRQGSQAADRGNDVGLRPREARGARREARRRRGGRQSRRRDRGRDEGEEGACRRCVACDAGGGQEGIVPGGGVALLRARNAIEEGRDRQRRSSCGRADLAAGYGGAAAPNRRATAAAIPPSCSTR